MNLKVQRNVRKHRQNFIIGFISPVLLLSYSSQFVDKISTNLANEQAPDCIIGE